MNPSDASDLSALWHEGWYQFAARRASPNYGARPPAARVDLILLHSISLPPGKYGGDEVQHLFTNELDWNAHPYFKSIEGMTVSCHFFIRRHGELLQFVSADARAWHAGESCYRDRSNCNDHSIGIELEGIEGGLFEDSQYETLASLCAALVQRYPVDAIAGHEHVAPGRKADPGPGFDWAFLQRALGVASRCFPDGVLAKKSP